jgi:outer membrane protein OmpA-like peptidoglycan-associated protein
MFQRIFNSKYPGMLRTLLLFIFQISICWLLPGQRDTIRFTNASFEDFPRNSNPPRGWYDCGFKGETPPDVQPGGGFDVGKSAAHGETYLGMVVRDNETWEAVSQRLNKPLQKGKCYDFSIYLSRSEVYVSQSRVTEKVANYVTPAKLRIYGGNAYCAKADLLGETSLVINTRWLEYKFRFEPTDMYYYITFEAFYQTPTLFPYNGNILVDNASAIVEVDCKEPLNKEEDPVAEATPPPPPPKPAPPREEPKKDSPPPAEKPKILKELADPAKIREGQTIKIDKLFFAMDSYVIEPSSFTVLDEVFEFMKNNTNVVVEIGGHTNTIPDNEYCDKLSTNRAKAVAEYLVNKGIPWNRLQFKGYGKRQPITLDTSQKGRQINQRVEIKILSVNG